ncbi:MAG: hypothetical protein GX613_06020 [Chloroflexi bacterium]|nr:hypothetical protein [Chloroflexota bacterium]
MRREQSAIRWLALILVLALGISACAEREATVDTGPEVRLRVGDATYSEPVYSYCWPQNDENVACDVNLAARAQPEQLVAVAAGAPVEFDLSSDDPAPQAMTVTLLDGLGGQTTLAATESGAAYTAPAEPGQYRVQVDVQYADVNGSEAYISYVFGLDVAGEAVAAAPTEDATEAATEEPVEEPTAAPTDVPETPTTEPTAAPTETPTPLPSPTAAPTLTPEDEATEEPTEEAADKPTEEATEEAAVSARETEQATEPADGDGEGDEFEPTREAAAIAQVTVEATEDDADEPTDEPEPTETPTARPSATARVTPEATAEETEEPVSAAAVTEEGVGAEPTEEAAPEATATDKPEPAEEVTQEATATDEPEPTEETAPTAEVEATDEPMAEVTDVEPDSTEEASETPAIEATVESEETAVPEETPEDTGALGSVALIGNVRIVEDRRTIPLIDAEVTFAYESAEDAARNQTLQTATDELGQFAFDPIELHEDDNILLTISALGYTTQEIELSGADAYSLPVINLILLPLAAPTPIPTATPTATPVPVEPTATPTPELPPTTYSSGAPILQLAYAGRAYEPLGYQLCQPGADGALSDCVQEPTGTTARRRLSLMRGAAAQLLIAGDERPVDVRIEYLTDTGVQTGQPEERIGDNIILFTVTPEPGHYILAVRVVWEAQQATYYFRVAVDG